MRDLVAVAVPLLLVLVAGVLVTGQHLLNSRSTVLTGRAGPAALLTYLFGTLAMVIVTAIEAAVRIAAAAIIFRAWKGRVVCSCQESVGVPPAEPVGSCRTPNTAAARAERIPDFRGATP
jgi:hypothetical protein